MAISLAKSHRDWCKKVGCNMMLFLCPDHLLPSNQNLEAWEEAKREIEKIPEHPNRAPIPEQGAAVAVDPPIRRNSTSTVNGR
jgi:sorting nexin-4